MKERMSFSPPLPAVPLPDKRMVDFGVLGTAAHEVNHWVVAVRYGEQAREVSVIPTSEYQGTTVLEKAPEREKFKVIAAAGAVPTSVGSAEGYDADLGAIRLLDLFQESKTDSVKTSRQQASKIISREPREILRKMAEIVAWFGKVPGSLYQKIKERAEFEIEMEKMPNAFPKQGIIFESQPV